MTVTIRQKPPEIDLSLIYTLTSLFRTTNGWKPCLESTLKLIRRSFVFDNLVVYLIDPMTMSLEVVFARATGRGKSAEADVAWGEELASRVLEEKSIILQEIQNEEIEDRLNEPYSFALPLTRQDQVIGALVFIRFGGPHFSLVEQNFGQFIADILSTKIEFDRLQVDRDNLEFQYRAHQVQEDFISTVSHELRNPLGFIKGYTTTLLREDAQWDSATQNEFLTIIDQETDHLQDLIANLLDSAKLQSGQIAMNFQAVRIEALINDLLLRTRLHHTGLKVVTTMKSPIKTIQGDARRIGQVLENLISNAVKYAPGSPVFISVVETESGIQIDVRDEGPGIAEKYQAAIFNRFFRLPENRPNVHGSGLGLFICKQIVQAHHGEIQLESRVGEGTTFHIYLPDQP
jgi:signal transduction histidine kinase